VTTELVTGIVDVHHADGACDLGAFRSGGGVAFIHKATEGGDFVDRAFARVLPTLKPAGLLAGAYHFANGTDAVKQAENYLRAIDALGGIDVLDVLDLESNDRSRFGTMSFEAGAAWARFVHGRRGRWPLFYTYESMLHREMSKASAETRATRAASAPLTVVVCALATTTPACSSGRKPSATTSRSYVPTGSSFRA
jgi:lysozyme